jgi:hypothetical protein
MFEAIVLSENVPAKHETLHSESPVPMQQKTPLEYMPIFLRPGFKFELKMKVKAFGRNSQK